MRHPVLMRIQKGRLALRRLVLCGLVLLQGTEASEAEISPPHGQTPAHDNAAPGNTLAQKEKTDYEVLMMGEAVDEDVHLGITDLLASNGAGLTEISSQFPSDVAAQKYFKKVLSRALSVGERGDKKNKAGQIVGERATALVATSKTDKPTPALLFTYGSDFYEIQSISSQHSQLLEVRITEAKESVGGIHIGDHRSR